MVSESNDNFRARQTIEQIAQVTEYLLSVAQKLDARQGTIVKLAGDLDTLVQDQLKPILEHRTEVLVAIASGSADLQQLLASAEIEHSLMAYS